MSVVPSTEFNSVLFCGVLRALWHSDDAKAAETSSVVIPSPLRQESGEPTPARATTSTSTAHGTTLALLAPANQTQWGSVRGCWGGEAGLAAGGARPSTTTAVSAAVVARPRLVGALEG
jgi:hypothetical protein